MQLLTSSSFEVSGIYFVVTSPCPRDYRGGDLKVKLGAIIKSLIGSRWRYLLVHVYWTIPGYAAHGTAVQQNSDGGAPMSDAAYPGKAQQMAAGR
ncbi:hypothetical protein PY730_27835 (plasmid) [Klebsiella pneumoniae]|nr:hypothetical protein PY730_27835 [Klebsiella pneumoniae]